MSATSALVSRKQKRLIWFSVTAALLLAFWFCLPSSLFDQPDSFVLEDARGELLGATIAADGQWRFPQHDTVPEKFARCITAFEDKRFYYHPGVDPLAMARAIRQNFARKRTVSGGSTLTMQVIRLARPSRRTLGNKMLEAVRAMRLELTHSKKSIMGLYASHAPFGSNVVGLDAAAWRYYGRDPAQLSWGEMAALAVLPNAPSLVHPGKNSRILLAKRNRLIDRLVAAKEIPAEDGELAKSEPVPDRPFALPRLAPHLLDRFRSDARADKTLPHRIRSTVSGRLQQQVSDILERRHSMLRTNGVNNIAALVLDVETGGALAYCGNIFHPENAELESHVDVIRAARSPGSTLKPFLYGAMLNEGMLMPNSLVPDIPTQIAGYEPENYDLGYDGAVPASRALARSLNIPAVRMLQQYRYERLHALLRKMGLKSLNRPPDHYGLSLILGGGEATLWELAGMYASMARSLNHFSLYKGRYAAADWHAPAYFTPENRVKPELLNQGLLNAGAIWQTFRAMEEVMRPGEDLLWQQFDSSQPVAWKTGTSFGFRDGWAIGVTRKYVVAVWTGNTDGEGRPGLIGVETAAPALFDIFRILPASPAFPMPVSDMAQVEVCDDSGFRAAEGCPRHSRQYVPKSCAQSPVCPYTRLVHLDKSGKFQVTDACESPENMVHKGWFVLPPAMEYYYKTRNYSYRILPPFLPGCGDTEEARPMELIYPKNHARIYIPLELDGERGNVIFNAAHRGEGSVFWHIDGNFVGETRNLHQLALNPSPGKHTITLVDREGNRLQQAFTVVNE
ncbi:MAG: penicillin-binding protein 1C [Mucilaginibacter polytrichastri]|nr:penicillin-binding protein 1C [Mucilaginibacter polytrichastri]